MMWWLLGGFFLVGLFGAAARRPVMNNYVKNYIDADWDGGGSCDDYNSERQRCRKQRQRRRRVTSVPSSARLANITAAASTRSGC